MTKVDLRRKLRGLARYSAEVAAEKSRKICERIVAMPAWECARTVAVYAANAHEPDPRMLWEYRGERVFAYPRVHGTEAENERLVFYRVDAIEELQLSRWGLHEPPINPMREVDPMTVDLVIVPGVGFTKEGERLVRGRGHYDRFLQSLRSGVAKVGICFESHVLPAIPVESHDARMDDVIFE